MRPGLTFEEHRRISELERENRELRQANEILRAAAALRRQVQVNLGQPATPRGAKGEIARVHEENFGVYGIKRAGAS